MWWLLSSALACDSQALVKLAAALTPADTPAMVGPRIAALCPRPVGMNRALNKPSDPQLDVQSAVGQVSRWAEVCEGGLDSIPMGFSPATSGERLELWSRCNIGRFEAFDLDEWLATEGPALSVILLADQLERSGVPTEPRVALVRAYAGIPAPSVDVVSEADVQVLGELDPLAGFRDEAPPRAVLLAPVTWPPGTEPDAVCLVEVEIAAEGEPSDVDWLVCPEELRSYITSALEASWFQPGRKHNRNKRGSIRLRYIPGSSDPVVSPAK